MDKATIPALVAALALTGGSLVGTAQETPGVTYAIDPEASRVLLEVGKSGLFSFVGHTHQVEAPVDEGTVTHVAADPSGSTVRVTFDAARLRVTGEGEPPEDVPEVQRTMASERVLDVARYPRITFASREIEVVGREEDALRLRVRGDLTLHGVTRPVTADVSLSVTADRLEARGALIVRQSDFGIEPVTAGAGTVRVKDEVEADFTLVGRKTP